jgi:iron complex transport system substrate-binding protein
MQADIDRIVADTDVPDPAPSFYHEISPDYFTATTDTFVGEVYALLGLANIADPAGEDGITFPQLNAEFIVDADPDLIFLADTKCCGETAESVAARDGWAEMSAVVNGNVIELDDDVASRWGPRVVELLQEVSDAVEQALAAA